MRDRSTLGILWRRRVVVAAIFLIFVVFAGVLSKTLPKVYSASSTLIVVPNENAATFDAVQAAQVTARTYSDVVAAPAIAAQVARQLGGGASATSVGNAVSVNAVLETQLLRISAEDRSPAKAQRIANTYAATVIAYVHQYLGSTAGATVALAASATRPTSPARPKPTLYVLIAAILGLSVGVGAAFLLERLDTRLRSAEEVGERFSETILARMPRRGRTAESLNAFNEAFGLLRTNLRFASPNGKPLKLIAVTSARDGEGKTTCVAQMGASMAEVGSHVLMVEADFRRPMLQRQVMPGESAPLRPGLSSYLADGCALEDVVHSTGTENVELVPTGPLPPNPSAFLESPRIGPTLRELAERADLVLLDCPPLSAGADALTLAGQVDGVIVVVDLDRSNERAVRNVLNQLEGVHAPVLGFVLNRDRTAEFAYDYHYAGHSAR